MSYTNNAKFYIDEHGRTELAEDTSFLVSGTENESAINLFVDSTLASDIVVYATFKRADGFVISNRSMELVGYTDDEKYYEFIYLFTNTDRILDIAGSLEVSFIIKTDEKTIATVSNVLYVRKNVKPNLETKTEEEFYNEAIEIVERTQQQANALQLNKLDKTSNKNSLYATDSAGNQTTIEYSALSKGNTVPKRDSEGQILVPFEPTADAHATSKQYVDSEVQKVSDDVDTKDSSTLATAQDYADTQREVAKTYTDTQIELERTTNTEKFDKKLNKNFLLYSKKTSVDGNEIIPILYNSENLYIEIKAIIDKVQSNVIDNTNSIVTFAYDNYQSFLERVETTTENGITTLVSITNEDNSLTLTANQINIGFTVLLREKNVPDYWLSKKSVESEYAINLFTEFETKLNLEDYVLKSDLVNYAKKEETIYNNATPTTSALGGIPKGTTFDNKPIKEILDDLLYPYVAFSASMSTSPNGGTYEKGTTQNVSTATVSITLGSKQITSIQVLDSSNNVLAEKTSGITTSNSFTINQLVTSNTNFKAIVTDGTTSKTVTSGTFTFVSPYYYGAIGDVELTETLIKGLTKSVSSKGTKTFTITMNQQKAVIAYPASYGNLTKILDENSFNVTDTFVKNTLTIDNVSYYVYVLNTPATSTMKYTFSY